MPSLLMHVAISKLANESLKLDERDFIIGTVIPDFGNKRDTHYYKYASNGLLVPDINVFLNNQDKTSPLILGNLSHLIADYEFFSNFINRFITYNKDTFEIITKYGQVLKGQEAHIILEQDYDILNSKLIKLFNLEPLLLSDKYIEAVTAYNSLLSLVVNRDLLILNEEEVIKFINETATKVIQKVKRIGEKNE